MTWQFLLNYLIVSSPRNHFHPPVLICCQIMFTSVIPVRAWAARDLFISVFACLGSSMVRNRAILRLRIITHVIGHNLLLFRRKLNLFTIVKYVAFCFIADKMSHIAFQSLCLYKGTDSTNWYENRFTYFLSIYFIKFVFMLIFFSI